MSILRFREPKTTQEFRVNEGHSLEYGLLIRAKRGRKHLPTSYSDRQEYEKRSWKAYRAAQYK
jgi:hypothetical protein